MTAHRPAVVVVVGLVPSVVAVVPAVVVVVPVFVLGETAFEKVHEKLHFPRAEKSGEEIATDLDRLQVVEAHQTLQGRPLS
jgi:uncharacterized protein involved in cysteine biosynthesis